MIVTRGLGRADVLGAISAAGLGRKPQSQVVDPPLEEPADALLGGVGGGRHRLDDGPRLSRTFKAWLPSGPDELVVQDAVHPADPTEGPVDDQIAADLRALSDAARSGGSRQARVGGLEAGAGTLPAPAPLDRERRRRRIERELERAGYALDGGTLALLDDDDAEAVLMILMLGE
jgi:hypothetical protein